MSDLSNEQLLDAHNRALEFMTKVIHNADGSWSNSSPCDEWTVRDVTNHIASENMWSESIIDGKTIEEVGDRFAGDVLGNDPVAAWDFAAKTSANAFSAPSALDRTVHLSFGEADARMYAEQMTFDLIVHAWDIARGSGQHMHIPAHLADVGLRIVEPMHSDLVSSGLFHKPIDVGIDADDETRLLALTGRKP